MQDDKGMELASIAFDRWSYTNATVKAGDATYRIEHPSWWKSSFRILDEGKREIGSLTQHWNGKSTLQLHGNTYTWVWDNW